MDAKEIYGGIAAAVEAAKPAQEYCFLWISHWSTCMTKSEWSGWMQAISVVFVLGIPWINSLRAKRKVRPVAKIVYRHMLKWKQDANRLDLLVEDAISNPAALKAGHQHAVSLVRSARQLTDDEINCLRLVSPLGASYLRAAMEVRTTLSTIFNLPVNGVDQHFDLQLVFMESRRHVKEFREQTELAVSQMRASGLHLLDWRGKLERWLVMRENRHQKS